MLATAIIVFREVLEAALVVGIVLAASRGVPRRGSWVSGGVAAGVLGAALVAAGAGAIAAAVNGIGQELFNAAILFTAVAMLGWHNVWMNRHGRELAASAATLGRAVQGGDRPPYALAAVVLIAVLREGSEIVLFLYGIAVGAGVGGLGMLSGGILGLVAGAAVGAVIYFGLLTIPLKRLFTVTSWLILLLAAGMASQGAAFLAQADLLPSLGNDLWNTSAIVGDSSMLGVLLHVLIGYSAQPAGIQIVFYLATILIIGTLMRWLRGEKNRPSSRPAAAATL
ncbi:MAG TPA: FTR1 family protein [Stellaceae bacterium]|jgi:high-affinity iron transporter|nr:FTR1 family protein [Stellaceae bacterium]